MLKAKLGQITVYGSTFNPYSQESTHTRMALYILDKYKDQVTLKFADLNQEVIQAHLSCTK